MITFFTLIILTAFGWFISLYFFLVHKHRIAENVWWMPSFLRMTNCRCDEIVESEFGRSFGRSNAYWGTWYYFIFMLIIIGDRSFNLPPFEIIFIISLLAFAYSIYLAWGLYIMRVACRPCLGAHLVNLLVFAICLYQVFPLLFN
ncbi:MAG: vitamin K epoxide reductase family protein [Candidatus Marinimicrobia bacterium]|nr:vitamin K epoxide reductase family protein [Candidatus Neomarinimicrobiota bacterium]